MKNLNHLVSLLQEGYTTVGVVFNSPHLANLAQDDDTGVMPAPWNKSSAAQEKQYTYKCQFKDIKLGDVVILPPSSEGKMPSLGVIARVDNEPELNFENGIEYKWLVGKVDFSEYQNIMDKERQMIRVLRDSEKARQRKELLEAYQLALPDDPESRKLFEQARLIGGNIIEG